MYSCFKNYYNWNIQSPQSFVTLLQIAVTVDGSCLSSYIFSTIFQWQEKLLVAQAKIEEMEKTGTIEDSKNSEGKQKAVTVKEGKGKKKGGKGNSAAKDSSAKRQAKVEKDLQAQVCLIKAVFIELLSIYIPKPETWQNAYYDKLFDWLENNNCFNVFYHSFVRKYSKRSKRG